MHRFEYNTDKNEKLKKERGISFNEIIMLISNGGVLDILDHPNQIEYPNQKIYVLDIEGYIWLVPHIQNKEYIFLKTAFPSRKHTRDYKGEKR